MYEKFAGLCLVLAASSAWSGPQVGKSETFPLERNIAVDIYAPGAIRAEIAISNPSLKDVQRVELKVSEGALAGGVYLPPGKENFVRITAFDAHGEKLYSGKGNVTVDEKFTPQMDIRLEGKETRLPPTAKFGTNRLGLGLAAGPGEPDHHRVHPVEIGAGAFQQGHDAFRCAGAQQRDALSQAPDVIRMETIDVFIWTNAFQQFRGIQMFRKRKLKQYAVNCRIVIEAIDQIGQRLLSGVGRQVIGLGQEADLFTVFTLVRDINLRGRIAADQDHREAGRAQTLLATLVDAFGDLLAQAGGDRFAVD